MKKVTKDQWKLAASWLSDISKGLYLAVFGLAISGKITASWPLFFAIGGIFFMFYVALVCARLGEKDNGDGDGN